MSKTVDELIGVYIEASNSVVWEAEKRGLCPMTLDMQRAGIAAVIRALRDEANEYHTARAVVEMLNEILGDAGNEKVAGGSAREDEKAVEAAGDKGPVTVNSPATTPAPVTIKETIAGTVLRMEQGYTGGMNDLSVTPATDPAPAVCEWRGISVLDGIDHYSTKHGVKNRLHLYRKDDVCPVCLAPIKFTEAK